MGSPDSTPEAPREEVRRLFARLAEPSTPMTAAEVADRLGCPREAAREELAALAAEGGVQSKAVDGTRVWWRSGADGDDSASGADGDDSASGADGDDSASGADGDDSADRGGDEDDAAGRGNDGQDPVERSDDEAEFAAFVRAVEDYAIFTLDADGTVISWNEGAERIKGYEESAIVGEHFSTFYTDGDRAAGVPARNLETATEEGRVEDEGWRVRADGSRFWANVTITAIRDDDGTLRGFTKVTRDMTERREYEQRLRRENEQTRKLLQTAPIAIAVQNADGEAVMANQRAQTALGLSEAEIVDEPDDVDEVALYDTGGDPLPGGEAPPGRVLDTREPVLDEEIAVEPADGDRRHFRVSAAPVFGDDDALERVVVAGEDITQLKRRERQLERRKSELETELGEIFDRISDAFYALDDDWRFTHCNDAAVEILQRPRDELLGTEVWEVFTGSAVDPYREHFERSMETQEPVTFEVYEDGIDTWLEFNAYPSETGLSVYFRDVSERKERERELERYETLFTESTDVNAVLNPDGTFQYLPPSVENVLGYEQDELVGEPTFERVHPDDRERVRADFGRMIDEPEYRPTNEFRYRHADGSWVWLESTGRNLLDDPTIEGLVAYTRDVTERHEYERQLVESERRYRVLAESFPDGIVTLFDRDFTYELAAGQGFDRIPLDPDDLEGNPLRGVWDDEVADELEPAFRATLDGEDRSLELEYEGREWLFHAVPITDDRGDVFAGMTLAQDITDRKERERELAKYETIVETINDGIYVKDEDGYFTTVNDAYAELTGYDRDELTGRHASLVVDEETITQARAVLPETPDDRASIPAVEAALETAGGDEVPVEGTFASLDTDDSRQEVGVVRDVSERKERERALRERERRLKRYKEYTDDVLDAIDDIFYLLDENGSLQRWNETLCAVTGYGDDVAAMDIVEFFAEDDREAIAAAIADGFETGHVQIEADVRTSDGERIPYEFVASTLEDPDGSLVLAGVGRDISDRMEYERRLEASNERLEQFAYAASHDLQEPLRMVSSYLRLVEERYADDLDAAGREFIDFAVDGADRMRGMVDGLLEYSRVDTRGDPFEAVDLDAVLADVRDDLRVKIDESGADVDVADLPTVRGDGSQLRQLFQNLLDNAIEYSGDESTRVTVTAERRATHRGSNRNDAVAETDRDQWVVSVSDNGIGIDPDDTDRIFEVFQRLHGRAEHDGTGIGLALCRRIVDRHGGEIWVDSEPGEGSTFHVALPAAGDDAPTSA